MLFWKKISRKSPPTPARIWMIVVTTPVKKGTPRHSMFGRREAGKASTTNGITPRDRYTIALSGTKAIIHMHPNAITAPSTYQPKIGQST
jgi:hypothetical protein